MSSDLDSLLPPDHNARAVWLYVQRLDLSPLYDQLRVRGSHPGRPATDPALLMALWLFATLEGVGSGRQLDRLCSEHIAYRWLCGGVSVNYHTLSDFRVAHSDLLERFLVDGVTRLMAGGLVDMARVAQDGVRVRASAGASSFRRRKTIERMRVLAKEQVSRLKSDGDSDMSAQQQAARRRAGDDLERRLDEALEQMEEVEKKPKKSRKKRKHKASNDEEPPSAAAKEEQDKKDAHRVSTTDPEARVMKMGDGGFRPAFNGQFSTDVATQIIVGVGITNVGSDKAEAGPMVDQLADSYGQLPKKHLVDNGYVQLETIEKLEGRGVSVIAPVQKPRGDRDPFQPLPSDGEGVAAWRKRMGTDEAKQDYPLRAAVAECVNALARNRGLTQFPVRGQRKCKAILLWFALAHNLRRALTLNPHLALGAG